MSTSRRALGFLALVLTLACGGLGSGASERADQVCEFLETERDCTCRAYPRGATPTIDGLRIEVISVKALHLGKEAKISSHDEQAALKGTGGSALAVEVEYTNTLPMKSAIEVVHALQRVDGETLYVQPYSSRYAMKDMPDTLDLWRSPSIGPGKKKRTILVFPAPIDAMNDGLLHLTVVETRPDPDDPRGRRVRFTDDQLVIDLGTPEG